MKIIYIAIGFICFALGAVGAFLPVLPTTPFLLVTAYCFAKSSERFHRWFIQTRLYQKHLDAFVTERAMTKKTKCRIMLYAGIMMGIAFILVPHPTGKIAIAAALIFKYYYFIFRIRTKEE